MVSRMITIALGIWLSGFLPALPGVCHTLLLPLALMLLALALPNARIALCLALLGGAAYSDYHGTRLVAALLPDHHDPSRWIVTGTITGLPEFRRLNRQQQWRFDLQQLQLRCVDVEPSCAPPALSKLRLSWRGHELPQLRAGQRWQWQVKLRRPRGLVNAAGFRYGDWLVLNGYSATGYVRGDARQLSSAPLGLRASARQRLLQLAANADQRGLLLALGMADRSGLSDADWRRFADTGTSHLLAISGLHIGIAGAFGALVGAVLGRILALRGFWLSACQIAPTLLLAGFYSTLAGWSLPTQRAFCMVLVAMLALAARRQISAQSGFCAALLAVLLIDPLAGHGVGFYLSFTAVALILWVTRGRRGADPLQLRPQWAVFVGMAPLLLVAFGQLPLLSLPANMLSIPLYTFLVVPMLLLAMGLAPMLPAVAESLLAGVDSLLGWQQDILAALQGLPPLTVVTQPPLLLLACAVAALCILLPRGVPGRAVAVLMLLLVVTVNIQRRDGEVVLSMTVLDVGQGLSVLLQQGPHTLVYDVGPAYDSGFNTGSAFLLPLLRQRGIDHIDTLVISHADADHAGSLPQVIDNVTPRHLLAGEALPETAMAITRCVNGVSVELGSAQIEALHPADIAQSGNNASCVLRLRFAGTTILLPGDIERGVETALLAAAEELRADIVLAPHHGSKTSSSAAFVERVAARHVVFSSGWRHHFGHPHRDVVARWHRRGGRQWSTARDGALHFVIDHTGNIRLQRQRAQQRRFWQL